jgi:hypothetical protein
MPLVQDFGPRRSARAAFAMPPLLACLAGIAAAAFAMSETRGVEPRWLAIPPAKEFAAPRLGELLPDIESRMPPGGHAYRNDADPINWAHETTHGLNSRIRNSVPNAGRVNAFYVGKGRAAVILEPRLRLSQIGPSVPAVFRDDTFGLYLVQMTAHWESNPLYVLDEWTAYQNGTQTGLELEGLGARNLGGRISAENMIEFSAFACCLLRLVESGDPSFADLDQLRSFIAFGVNRSLGLAAAAQSSREFSSPRLRRLVDAFLQEFAE